MKVKKKKTRRSNNRSRSPSPDHSPTNPTPYSDAIEIDENILGGDMVHVNLDKIKSNIELATKDQLTFSDR